MLIWQIKVSAFYHMIYASIIYCDHCEQIHNSNLFCLSSCISLFGKTKSRKWSWNHIVVHSKKQLCLAFAQLIYSFIQLKTSKEYVIKLASKLRYKLQLLKESLYHGLSIYHQIKKNWHKILKREIMDGK